MKLTCPGVPDIYQGSELWDLRLVDPDNRGPVDFAARGKLLEELKRLTPEQILARSDEGLPKLWLIQRTLAFRQMHPQVFDRGAYEPLAAEGAKADHVVAFLRGDEAVIVVPRLVMGLAGNWEDTSLVLPAGHVAQYIDRRLRD